MKVPQTQSIQLKVSNKTDTEQAEQSTESNNLGNMVYCCGNKRVCGRSFLGLVTSVLLILLPTILFWVVTLPQFEQSGIIAISIVTAGSLIVLLLGLADVASTIPGYLKKGNISEETFLSNQPMIIVKGMEIQLKYCSTCRIVREPRSFHCNVCGNCIRKHDHHCPWVNNCVGEKTIRKFLTFLSLTCLHAVVVCICSTVAFVRKLETVEGSWDYLIIIDLILLGYSATIIITMLVGIVSQCYFISRNITTNEYLRSRLPSNLWDEGCSVNWRRTCDL